MCYGRAEFHQYNPVYNPPFLNYDFSIEFQFFCIILEDKNHKNAQEFPLIDTFYVNFSIGSYFKVISSAQFM